MVQYPHYAFLQNALLSILQSTKLLLLFPGWGRVALGFKLVHLGIYCVLPAPLNLCLRLLDIYQAVLWPNPYLFYWHPSSELSSPTLSHHRYSKQGARFLWSDDGGTAIPTKSEIQRIESIGLMLKILRRWRKACLSYWHRLEIARIVLQTKSKFYWQSEQIWTSQSAHAITYSSREKAKNLTWRSIQATSVLTARRWHRNQLRSALRRGGKKTKKTLGRRGVEEEVIVRGKIEATKVGRWEWEIKKEKITRGRLRLAPGNRVSWFSCYRKDWK